MADYTLKNGNGTAFTNKRRTEDKHPSHTGEIKLPDGKVHFLDIWVKQTRAGDNYFSIRIGNEKTGAKSDEPVMDNTQTGGFSRDLDLDTPF